MALQIWSDNETEQDLLGFRVHADLIRSVVTDKSVLPIVLGVFADWGGGKSSIMRMLQKNLATDEKTVCLYFNGWMFEGYEDAKTALISSILIELGEHKRFGPAVKDNVVGLLKRVRWMEVAKLGFKHVGIPVATALLTGGVSGVATVISAAAGAVGKIAESPAKAEAKDAHSDAKAKPEKEAWSDLIDAHPAKPDVLEIRKFREDFAEMLAKTEIESLVILIDDLDRCLPERIIETLEAIKLFVAVPKTAFVIGADPRIVRHAIATRYVKRQLGDDGQATAEEQYDLVQDYLEKLIQVPYHLPRLSPSEIETYMNLLACQHGLGASEWTKVIEHWRASRNKNLYAAYRQAGICEALGSVEAVPAELLAKLAWSNAIADVITDGLKGNPRQVKRMLNAMALRKQLADVAGIRIRDEVLAKLMVLEYSNLSLFQELGKWQAGDNGFPKELRALEASVTDAAEKGAPLDGISKDWLKPVTQNWLRMQPILAEVDLRDYFWLARDRTNSTLSGVTMVAPIVRHLFEALVSENKGERQLAIKECSNLKEAEMRELLAMLGRQIERYPDQAPAFDSLLALAEARVADAGQTMVDATRKVPRKRLLPAIAYRLQTLASIKGPHETGVAELLETLSKDQQSLAGRAASKIKK
jgi:hypothetical protein